MKRFPAGFRTILNDMLDSYPRVVLFTVLGVMLAVFSAPIYGQDETVTTIEVEITCYNEAGELINTGLGTISIDENGEGTLLFTEPELAEQCVDLSLQLLEGGSTGGNQDDTSEPETVEGDSGDGDNDPTEEGIGSLFSGAGIGGDTDADADAPEPEEPQVEEPETVDEPSTFGSPVDASRNFGIECGESEISTDNAFRFTAFLPEGEYTASLFTMEFQTFDPLLVIGIGDQYSCFTESTAIREYVVDFSQGGIGGQVFGHRSGGLIEFEIANNPDGVTPVEFIIGGQNGSAGTSGEFMFILEGARLTPQRSVHLYSLTITESLFESDAPLSVIMMGVNDTLDPHLTAATFDDNDELVPLYICEDAGSACDSDVDQSLAESSVVEAAVRTVRADDQDAAIVAQPGAYLANGVQTIYFFASQDRQQVTTREEYILVVHGGLR